MDIQQEIAKTDPYDALYDFAAKQDGVKVFNMPFKKSDVEDVNYLVSISRGKSGYKIKLKVIQVFSPFYCQFMSTI